jgi:tetratricopeptide (TPR) repeat protein
MKKTVKLVLTATFLGLFSFVSYSQDDVNKAIDLYNQAKTAAQTEDFDLAISKSQEAYAIVKTAPEGSEEVKANLEKVIPQLYLSKANKSLKDNKYDEAVKEFTQTIAEAKKFNNAEIQKDAAESIPKVYLVQADALNKLQDFDGAIAAYDKVLAIDSTGAQTYLLKAVSLQKKGDNTAAITGFEKAAEIAKAAGDDKITSDANTQLANTYLKAASSAQKEKKWTDVIKNAEKSLEYKADNASALKLLDFGNLQLGLAAQKSNNKAKACQYYKKVTNDAALKEIAAKSMQALGC